MAMPEGGEGTGGDARRGGVAYAVPVALAMALLAAPLVLMPFAPSAGSSAEKRELAPLPSVTREDGSPNLRLLSDAGDYFSDHFAFRPLLVDLDATLKQRVFLTSATDTVVVGDDGWLYYAGTLNDYQRRNRMSDRKLANIAHNLALVQESLQARGKRFALAIAPNKSSLYPEHMPYYLPEGEGPSNYERLLPLLRERGVNVVDLHAAFGEQGSTLYFQRDSHWTDEGALLAYGQIMAALGREAQPFGEAPARTDGHEGDVDGMLHPVLLQAEVQEHRESVDQYEVTNEAEGVEDGYIVTAGRSPAAAGRLVMYRDSFGNNLLPPFATTYEQAVFTKLVPFDMGDRMTGFAEDVVIERAERHLGSFASDPPYLPAPERTAPADLASVDAAATVVACQMAPYLLVEGTIDETLANGEGPVLVGVEYVDGSTRWYEAFRVSEPEPTTVDAEGGEGPEESAIRGDGGYRAYIPLGDQEVTSVRVAMDGAVVGTLGM